MSVIRHQSFFHRRTHVTGNTELFRKFGKFEKILVLADKRLADEIQSQLEENFFDVHHAEKGADAIRLIMQNDFAAVIIDTALSTVPIEMLHTAIEKIRPELVERFIFLVSPTTDRHVTEFIERIDGLKVWREIEISELFQMIEIVLGRTQRATDVLSR